MSAYEHIRRMREALTEVEKYLWKQALKEQPDSEADKAYHAVYQVNDTLDLFLARISSRKHGRKERYEASTTRTRTPAA